MCGHGHNAKDTDFNGTTLNTWAEANSKGLKKVVSVEKSDGGFFLSGEYPTVPLGESYTGIPPRFFDAKARPARYRTVTLLAQAINVPSPRSTANSPLEGI